MSSPFAPTFDPYGAFPAPASGTTSSGRSFAALYEDATNAVGGLVNGPTMVIGGLITVLILLR